MKDEKLAELIFLDEFRSQTEQESVDWHRIDESELPSFSDEELDDFHYEYLTGRSDFEWRKEEAEKMINEILEDREKEDT